MSSHASTLVSHPAIRTAGRGLGRLAWGTGGALFLLLVTAFLRTDSAGLLLRSGVFALAAFAAIAPRNALLVLAGLSPFSTMLTALAGATVSGTAVAEAMVLATTGPWMLRMALASPLPTAARRLAPVAAVLVMIAMTSCIVQLTVVRMHFDGTVFTREVWTLLSHAYFERSPVLNVMTATGPLIEGVVLLLMTATLCAQVPLLRVRLPLMIVSATAGMATLNLTRLLTGVLRSETPLHALRQLWFFTRISMHYDRNAAGSVFSMVTLVAAGCYSGTSRRRQIHVACGIVLLMAGLWLTGSRTALAATVVMGVAFAMVIGWHHPDRTERRYAAFAGAAVLAFGTIVAALYPETRNPDVEGSLAGRQELAITALRMSAAHPVFGVGIGRFYDLSDDYGRPQLSSVLPSGTQENAHNNFLQVLAELGMTGLAALLWLLAMALLPAIRAARAGKELPASAALAGGVLAYLLTWLTGHPLLVPEALYPFFMVLGVTAVVGIPSPDPAPTIRPARSIVVSEVVVILLLAGLPLRIVTAIREVDLEGVGYGLSEWQHDSGGERFRVGGARVTVFVPSDAGAVDLPLRLVPGTGHVDVEVSLDGRVADRVQLTGDAWQISRIVIPPARARYRRLDLRSRAIVATEAPALRVGRIRPVHGETKDIPVPPGPARAGWIAGDYDGDGAADPVVYQTSTGAWRIGKRGAIHFGEPGDRPVPADYNGDGVVDVAVYRPAAGLWLVRGQEATQFGEPDDIPVPGDYDGDGRVDLAVFRPSTSTWLVRNLSAIAWGDPGDVPVPGDYDGDGRVDLAVYRPSTGTWYVRNQSVTQFGEIGDVPVPGDYDGDGAIDIAVYRPSSGTWYVRYQFAVQYGNAGDIPVPGDYNGGRAADLAVYRPSIGIWFVRK